MDWAEQQTHCPAGHDVKFPRGKTSWTACNGCPASKHGLGHFELWCDACRRFYSPPHCQDPVVARES